MLGAPTGVHVVEGGVSGVHPPATVTVPLAVIDEIAAIKPDRAMFIDTAPATVEPPAIAPLAASIPVRLAERPETPAISPETPRVTAADPATSETPAIVPAIS